MLQGLRAMALVPCPCRLPSLLITGPDCCDTQGSRMMVYKNCTHEIFAGFGECARWDGMVERITKYADENRHVVVEVRATGNGVCPIQYVRWWCAADPSALYALCRTLIILVPSSHPGRHIFCRSGRSLQGGKIGCVSGGATHRMMLFW